MIVPMKKTTVVVLESRKERELARLKRLGMLHPDIEHRSSEQTEQLLADRDALTKALAALPGETEAEQDPVPGVDDEAVSLALEIAGELQELLQKKQAVTQEAEQLRSELSRLEPWGEFDPADIRELAERGIRIDLFQMNAKEFRKAAPSGSIKLKRVGKTVLFVLPSLRRDGEQADPESLAERNDIVSVKLPQLSPAEMSARVEQCAARSEELEKLVADRESKRAVLAAAAEILNRRLEHERVRLGMDSAERVAYISGFVPADSEDTLRKTAANNGWGLLIREPDESDDVPTKIRNPRWVRTIKPVFNMLGVVPGYRERDISLIFLLFFTVFVGMIIGDAGYGALLFLGAVFGTISSKRKTGKVGEGVVLLTVLSVSTLAWGALTGNWFGYEPISRIAPFRFVVVPALNSFDPRSNQAVQSVCFILAAVHLSIAHIWNFFRELGSKPAIKAFAQIGWLGAVLGIYFLVVSLFLGQPMPQYALYMIIAGMGFVFIFSGQTPEKGFFGGVARGLSNAFTIVFDGIGAFSDIISYIRLFAVGLASVAIAQAFNEMAASVGSSPVGYIMAAVILIFGHTLNLIMGGLAVVVHGVRLNLLEFSGHLGMEWTGVPYQPFSENEQHT